MASVVPDALDTRPFEDGDLWQLGLEKNWEELKRILAPITGKNIAVTEQKQRLLMDDIRRKFDSATDGDGRTIVSTILATDAAYQCKARMADALELVLSVGAHPDMPDAGSSRPAHLISERALVEFVATIFACRPDMCARNGRVHTPYSASTSSYVSEILNATPFLCYKRKRNFSLVCL
jgi:hypothetical protein